MKKRKILYLFPVAALLLSGCTVEEGLSTVKGFVRENIYTPLKSWVKQLLGQEEQKKEDKKDDQKPSGDQGGDQGGGQGGDQGGGGQQGETSEYGTLENPITVSAAVALIDEGAPTEERLYVVGEVKSNEAWSTQYENTSIILTDGTHDIKVFRTSTFPEGFDKTAITQNSMKGQTVVASGTGDLYNETYELTENAEVHSITGEGPQHVDVDNYGTESNPLSVSEAVAVIDLQDPTEENLYVVGTVTANTAWSTQYNNIDITISDGQKELTLFRANKFPDGYAYSTLAKDELVGKTVVGKGIGTLYNGTKYELNAGCEVLSIETPVVAVSSVEVTPASLQLEVGQQYQLSATVLPENATEKGVEWSSSSDAKAEVSQIGIITAHEEGNVVITCTTLDGGLTDTCELTVVAATKNMVDIEIRGEAKAAYTEGEPYSHEGLSVYGIYNDQSEDDITSLVEWQISKENAEVGDDEITITATYGNFSDNMLVAVTVAEAKGTLEHPYTGAEAAAIAAELANKTPTAESYYIRGAVTKFNEAFNSSYGNYSFTIEGGFVGWRLKNGSGFAKFNEGDLEVGDTVTMYVAIQNYDGTPESSGGYIHSIDKATVDAVAISGTATQTEYGVGGTYSHAGLVATATMSTGIDRDVTEAATWAASKETAELGDTSVSFTVTYDNVTSEAFAVSVTVTSAPIEQVYKSVSFVAANTSDSISSYTAEGTYTDNGFSVKTANFNNNKKGWDFIKCGRKADASVAKITTSAAIDKQVTKVNISFTTYTVVSGTTAKVLVSSSADMSNATEYAFTPAANTTVSVPITTGVANAYYQVVFDCVAHGSTNGYIWVTAVSYSAVY